MPGMGGFFKAIRASSAKDVNGVAGTYRNAAGDVKVKPGYKQVGDDVVPEEGILARVRRNPKTTIAGVAGLGGAYYMYG